MQCNFCDRQIFYSFFYCQCDQDVVSCANCCSIGCYKCSGKLYKAEAVACTKCNLKQPKSKLYYCSFYAKFCIKCVSAAIKDKKSAYVMLGNQYSIQRQKIQQFLSNFCCNCHHKLKKQQKQINSANQWGQKLCQPCQIKLDENKKQKRDIPIKYKMKQQIPSKDDRNTMRQKQREEQQKIRQEKIKRKQCWEKWKQIQSQNYFVRCISCGKTIFEDSYKAIINDQVAICQYCADFSQAEEKIINSINQSRIASNSRPDNKRRQRQPQIKQQIKQHLQIQEQPQQINKQQKIKDDPTKNTQSIGKSQTSAEKNKQEEAMQEQKKPMDNSVFHSQPKITNVKLQISWQNDENMLQCNDCGVEIQATTSIWEEESNAPLCRCCFADLIFKIQQEYNRDKYNYSPNRKRRYMQKYKSEAPQTSKQNAIDLIEQKKYSNSDKKDYQEKKFNTNNKKTVQQQNYINQQSQPSLPLDPKKKIGVVPSSIKKAEQEAYKKQRREQQQQNNVGDLKNFQSKQEIYLLSRKSQKPEKGNQFAQIKASKAQPAQVGVDRKVENKKSNSISPNNIKNNQAVDMANSISNKIRQNQIKDDRKDMKQKQEDLLKAEQNAKRYRSSHKQAQKQILGQRSAKSGKYQYYQRQVKQEQRCSLCGNFISSKQYVIDGKKACYNCKSEDSLNKHRQTLRRRLV